MPHAKRKSLKIFGKRAYEDATPKDGYRLLVDRLWPRGRKRDAGARSGGARRGAKRCLAQTAFGWRFVVQGRSRTLELNARKRTVACAIAGRDPAGPP